jgi:O-methyltransferase involved in polyketide biosynthesis
MADLVYHGERSHVVEYLAEKGWQVSAKTVQEATEANGFEFPADYVDAAWSGLSYVSAVLTPA